MVLNKVWGSLQQKTSYLSITYDILSLVPAVFRTLLILLLCPLSPREGFGGGSGLSFPKEILVLRADSSPDPGGNLFVIVMLASSAAGLFHGRRAWLCLVSLRDCTLDGSLNLLRGLLGGYRPPDPLPHRGGLPPHRPPAGGPPPPPDPPLYLWGAPTPKTLQEGFGRPI